jgi:hypothetical protein
MTNEELYDNLETIKNPGAEEVRTLFSIFGIPLIGDPVKQGVLAGKFYDQIIYHKEEGYDYKRFKSTIKKQHKKIKKLIKS